MTRRHRTAEPADRSGDARGGAGSFDPVAVAAALEAEAVAVGDPGRAGREALYLKLPDWTFHGASVPKLHAIARDWSRTHGDLRRTELLAVVEALWAPTIWERRRLAVEVLAIASGRLEADDLAVVERLLRESRTWALVDELAVHVAGPLVVRFPESGATLDRWAADGDFWLRRSAMLALLVPLRGGGGDWARFTRFADAMLDEREFFVRKAIG